MPTDASDLVARAVAFCIRAHAGQKRDNGTDYWTHPEAVAEHLRASGVTDPTMLAAAYLHDVVEDTSFTAEDLRAEFGAEVADLVVELTSMNAPGTPFEIKQARLVEHCRRMSPRARYVKLADRLHNLQDMVLWPVWKQQRYARAALELLDVLRPWPDEALAARVRELAEQTLATP